MVAALVVAKYFKNSFLSFSTSYILTIIIAIIYLLNIIDSLGIYTFLYIYYRLISIILRGEYTVEGELGVAGFVR